MKRWIKGLGPTTILLIGSHKTKLFIFFLHFFFKSFQFHFLLFLFITFSISFHLSLVSFNIADHSGSFVSFFVCYTVHESCSREWLNKMNSSKRNKSGSNNTYNIKKFFFIFFLLFNFFREQRGKNMKSWCNKMFVGFNGIAREIDR